MANTLPLDAIHWKVPDADFDTRDLVITRWSHPTVREPDAETLAIWEAEYDSTTAREDAGFAADNDAIQSALCEATYELVAASISPGMTQTEFEARYQELYRGKV